MNNEKKPMTARETAIWLAIRREARLKIDPETAEVDWTDGMVLDPYGLDDMSEFTEDPYCAGCEFWARSPGSDIWVNFGDLPDDVREKLWAKHYARTRGSVYPR